MNFINNRIERQLGMDLNGDRYVGGQGLMGRLEHASHIDFNRDNIIGRRPDIMPGYPGMYGQGGYPGMYGQGGYSGMYGQGGYPGNHHHRRHHHGGSRPYGY